jgi:hypothetical protein
MPKLSEDIINVASRYLGPEAKRFLERQATHLENGVTLETLTPKDVEKLAWWTNVSAKLIMDKEHAKELSMKIAALGMSGHIPDSAQ